MSQSCALCGGKDIAAFLHRPQVPVHQNLIARSEAEAKSSPRGTLDMTVCCDCGFVFNRAFDPSLLSYGEDYDNCQTCSPAFADHVDTLVRRLIEEEGVRGATVVEVGCGQGHFLRQLVAYPDADNRGVGFDPSYRGPGAELGGRLAFHRAYYDESCADLAADIVVCRHVIEHVPNPPALLRSVARALSNSPWARVFFETPCVEWILENKVVWDFFYEHCSLFTAQSLAYAFERCGFNVDKVGHVFGDQYLWLEAKASQGPTSRPHGRRVAGLADAYGKAEAALTARLSERVEKLGRRGPVALWGAGAKGATFANLIDPQRRSIACVIDINPAKQGGFVPGAGHPIVSPEAAGALGVRTAVLMNPNYRRENEDLVANKGLAIELTEWSNA